MKKVLFLFAASLAILGCSGSDDSPSVNFTSTAQLNGVSFEPSAGVYSEPEPDTHKRLQFTATESTGAIMNIDLFIPFSQTEVTGNYNMGIGTNQEALASVYLYKNDQAYFISSDDYLHITDLGNSRFRFDFGQGYAIVLNGETLPFSGFIEGKFTLTQN